MRLLAGILPIALAAASPSLAESPEEIFSRGNSAYEAGRFDESAEAYRGVLRYGVRDARVEYNLGCAAFRTGRLGESVLHFERAARLAPGDPDVRTNLELVRSRCFDRVEEPEIAAPVRWVRAAQDRLGPDRQAVALLVLLWAACAWIVARAWRPEGWTPAAAWVLAALLAAGGVVGASWLSTRSRIEAPVAVVLESSIEVRAGPGEHNAVLFTAHEGLGLSIREERSGWLQVSLPNGLNGWVPASAVGRV